MSTSKTVKTTGPPAGEIVQPVSLNETSLATMVSRAIDQLGGDGATAAVDAIKQLVELRHAEEDRHARREFARCMALYRQQRKPVPKNRTADKTTRGGTKRVERYADLAEIERSQGPLLAQLGFSWRWENQKAEGKTVAVRTILMHEAGHEVGSTVPVPVDAQAPMNETQKHGSSYTYAQRYGLIQVLGLTTTDPDDTDGVDPEKQMPIGFGDKAEYLKELIAEAGKSADRFLAWIGVEMIEDVPEYRYEEAVKMLRLAARKKGDGNDSD